MEMTKPRYTHRLQTLLKRTTSSMQPTHLVAVIRIVKLIDILAVRNLVQTTQIIITAIAPLFRNSRRVLAAMRSTMSPFL